MLPLKGTLILDCSSLLPGSLASKLLALQGATVIKIENPDRPDPARKLGPYYFDDLNSGKKQIALNLLVKKDRTQFKKLVKKADGLIEGFRPQAKQKLGLDAKTLHAVNPRLCIASIVGYPESGPMRDRPGHDLNFEARTGCLSLFNEMPALPLGFFFSAHSAALALVSSMNAVRRGEHGRRVVISISEVLKQAQSGLIREYRHTRKKPYLGGTLFSGKFPCYRLYEAKDGRKFAVGCIESKFWHKFCQIIGLPKLADKAFAEGTQGKRVIAQVQSALARKNGTFWTPLFERAECCVEPVLDYKEVYGV